jgi:hypothetical protein
MMLRCIVKVGCVDVPDLNMLGEQRRLAALSPGFSARNGAHIRRYWVHEMVMLSEADAERLVAAGVVAIVQT